MNELARKLAEQIRVDGPLTVADYMAACLADPQFGYYMRAEPFGQRGDFITAPEISQMFGELVGLWAVATWEMMGEPERFALIELGPGRGTLMADLVRAAMVKPAFLRAAELHLVEMSPRLREVQRQALEPTGLDVTWHVRLHDIPALPSIVIANEFFDAMPVRQFQIRDGVWSERMVGLGDDDTFVFGHQPMPDQAPPADLPEDVVIEMSPLAGAVMTSIADRLVQHGGGALAIDYGSAEPTGGSTLQAVRNHTHHDPLVAPGEADVTAHVDFGALARAANVAGARSRPVMTQGEFLVRMGLVERANVLGRNKEPAVRDGIARDMERLAGDKGMGKLFKVMAVSAPDLPLPVFDTSGESASEGADKPESAARPAQLSSTPTPDAARPRETSRQARPSPGHDQDRKTRH